MERPRKLVIADEEVEKQRETPDLLCGLPRSGAPGGRWVCITRTPVLKTVLGLLGRFDGGNGYA